MMKQRNDQRLPLYTWRRINWSRWWQERYCTFSIGYQHRQESLTVVAIIGMRGLGKTALAQSIYDDMKENKHFELTTWVCISEEFDIKVIVENFIVSHKKET